MERNFFKWNKPLIDPGDDNTVKNIIYDSDAGPDCDDTAALTMLYHYEDIGKAKVLATVCDTSTPYGAPFLSAMNTYYGRRDISVGTMKTKDNVMAVCRGFNFNIKMTASYETQVADGYEARDAVDVYREALSKAEDNSVTILVIGMQTNLADLLKSKADKWSKLDGIQLVAKKVKLLSAMAGFWPTNGNSEFNIRYDVEAAQLVADKWPTPIVYSGGSVGDGVKTEPFYDKIEPDSPLRVAWHKMNSWDLTSALYAVEGLSGFWTLARGDAYIEADGTNHFIPNDKTGARFYLVEDPSRDEEVAVILNERANAPKKNNPNEKRVYSIAGCDCEIKEKWQELTAEDENQIKHSLKWKLMTSNKKLSSMSVEFEGEELYIYGGRGVGYGGFEVFVDGRSYGVCNTAIEKQPQFASQHIYTVKGLKSGKHKAEIVLTDDKKVVIDFFRFVSADK